MKLTHDFPHIEHALGQKSLYSRLLLFVAGIVVLSLFAQWFEFYIPEIEVWIKGLGGWAPLAFILLFIGATPFFLSVDALCLAAGILFPLLAASLYIIISTYLAATVIFILGRSLFQNKVKQLLAKHPKLENMDAVLVGNDFKIMFLLRLLPLPFALLSYAFSATQVKFKAYILSTSGILIYNLTLVYFGYTAKHIASMAHSVQAASTINYPLLIIGAIGIALILTLIVKIVRKTLKQITPDNTEFKE